MISIIIFDLGGVILSHPKQITPYVLATTFHIDYDLALQEYNKIQIPWRSGKSKGQEILEMFRKKFTQDVSFEKIFELYKKEYLKIAIINENMMELIKLLKKKFRIVLSTNTQDIHHKLNKERGLLDRFDKIYASWQIGLVKPKIEYFKYILQDLKTAANTCLFVDDKEENIKAAKDVGMKVYLFDSAEKFQSYLHKKGYL